MPASTPAPVHAAGAVAGTADPAAIAAATTALGELAGCTWREEHRGYGLTGCPQAAAAFTAAKALSPASALEVAHALGADPSPHVRYYVALLLADHAERDPATAARLVALLRAERAPEIRGRMTRMLEERGVGGPLRDAAREDLVVAGTDSAAADTRLTGFAVLAHPRFAKDAAAQAALVAALPVEPVLSAQVAMCAQLEGVDGARLLPVARTLIAASGSAAALVDACVAGLIAIAGNTAGTAEVRRDAWTLALATIPTLPRDGHHPSMATIARMPSAIGDTRQRGTPLASEPWFDAPAVARLASDLIVDEQAPWGTRSSAVELLVATGADVGALTALRTKLGRGDEFERSAVRDKLTMLIEAGAPR